MELHYIDFIEGLHCHLNGRKMTSHLNFEIDPTNNDQKSALNNFLHNGSFVDVTLVTDDGKYIQAHKVILSSISEVFSNILQSWNNIPNVGCSLLYMKGVKHDSLQQILDFIYKGKTSVPMNMLADFMTLSKDLKITGLLEDNLKASEEEYDGNKNSNDMSDTASTNIMNEKPKENVLMEVVRSENDLNKQDVTVKLENIDDHQPIQNLKSGNVEDEYKIIDVKSESAKKESTHSEYRQLIDSYIERKENGNFNCKECQFVSLNKGLVRQHAETHCVHFRFVCKHCGEIFKREMKVQCHVKKTHHDKRESKPKKVEMSENYRPRPSGQYLMNHEKYTQFYKVKRSNEDMTHSDYEFHINSMIERRASRDFMCKQCSHTGKSRSHIKEHVESHIEGFEFICKECGETTRRTRDMQFHIRKAHVFVS